jgi:transposase-like protein/IS1 family transposase
MDLSQCFCPNTDCPARGHTQRGNVRIHDPKRKRLRCTLCASTFSYRTGTPFLALKTEQSLVTLVLALVAHGCPVPAIEAAFGLDRRTVRAWVRKAGDHARFVHEALVLQPHDIQRVEVDELFARSQAGAPKAGSSRRWLYVFSAICVPTRLWLGGVISAQRDAASARRMAEMVRRAARRGPLLVIVDGFAGYVSAFLRAFREAVPTGRVGRPRLVTWSELVLVRHVKQSRLTEIAHGGVQAFARLWRQVGSQTVSTSYIERLNATFRERLAPLARRSRYLVREARTLESLVYLMGTMYNFCWVHRSLGQTPAMAAGLASTCWSVEALLWHRVPPPRWRPKPHRGPLSKQERALLAEWGS